MNRSNPIGHFTFYRFCVFLANWRVRWRRAPSASRWMNRRIISISSTSSRSWISWRVSVIPWLRLCMTWISQRCIVIDWSRYKAGRWSAQGRRRRFWHRISSRSSMMWTVRSTMGRMNIVYIPQHWRKWFCVVIQQRAMSNARCIWYGSFVSGRIAIDEYLRHS